MKRALLTLLLAGCSGAAAPLQWGFDPDAEEGPHKDVEVEWWYHWGFLTDEDGGEWTLLTSFFRAKKKDLPQTRYFLHDLTNLKTGERSYRSVAGEEVLKLAQKMTGVQKFPPPHGVIPGDVLEKPGDPLKLKYGDDLFERTGRWEYLLKTGDVDVRLRATSDPMAVEGTGLTGITAPEDMKYYTVPRLEATGTVKGRNANGVFWYDHQWGKAWTDATIGWTWWGLHLDDGTNVNAYVLRNIQTGEILRSVCTRDGRVSKLTARPLLEWISPTQTRYPVAWRLQAVGLDVRVEPLFKERESPILGEQESIWEGPVKVTGSARGRGYQELVSFARERRLGK
jgi:predicted secreted hydrolase